MSKEFKVIRAKFKVADDVSLKDVKAKVKSLKGYEELAFGESETMIEVTVEGETFTKAKPKPEPKKEKK